MSGARLSIPPGATIRATNEQVSAELNGEASILNMKDGVYYGLDPVGTRVWQLLAAPMTFDALCSVMLAEFEVDEPRLRADLQNLLADLSARGLVDIVT